MIIKAIISFISTVGFSIMFNLPRKLLFHAGITGALGFIAYSYVIGFSEEYILAALLGSFVVGIIGQVFAIITKHPSTLFAIPGIIPLVPGYDLYNSMFFLVSKDMAAASNYGIKAIMISIAIACGVAVSTTIMLRLKPGINRVFVRKKN